MASYHYKKDGRYLARILVVQPILVIDVGGPGDLSTGADELVDGALDEGADEGLPGPDEEPAARIGRAARLAVRERGHVFEARDRGRFGAPREAEVGQLAAGRRHRRGRLGQAAKDGKQEELDQDPHRQHLLSATSLQLGLR